MSERRAPWVKWYPADWRADPRLRMCSLAARGLWIELLGYMHEAEPYGHFIINGRAPTDDEIAALVGVPPKLVRPALAELQRHGVPSLTDEGVMFSRRMVRDKAKADADRANGRSGGNPNLKGGDNPPTKPPDKPRHNGGGNPPHKAQRLEARDQKPEAAAAGALAAPPPPPSPLALPPDAAAEHAKRTEVGQAVLAAARIDEARWLGSFALVSAWLSAGYDPELDILPAVRQCASRPGYAPPRTLSYFTGAIEEHWRQRALDIPAILRRPQAAPPASLAERRWDRAMTRWIDGGCVGPKPELADFADAADPEQRPNPAEFGIAS